VDDTSGHQEGSANAVGGAAGQLGQETGKFLLVLDARLRQQGQRKNGDKHRQPSPA
jgi:hypothetical protein